MCVVGARPNFMKIKPIVDELDRRGVAATLVHTGQHYDSAMSEVFFDDLQLRRPDLHLGIGAGSNGAQVAQVLTCMEQLLAHRKTDAVVVVGDVNSTVGAALATAHSPALLAHVEAGLRSGDWSMPEEVNRIVTDRVSDVLFAPTAAAAENLMREGRSPEHIEVVGDVMAEVLQRFLPVARRRPIVGRLGLTPGRYALATLHRPANVDEPQLLTDLLGTLDELAATVPVVLPMHPRTRRRMAEHRIDDPRHVTVVPPLGYLDFVALQAGARLVLTDSGSVQEEARSQGLPCLTLRATTERPDTVDSGVNELVGTDRTTILAAAQRILSGPPQRSPVSAVGPVGERIVTALLQRIT